MAPAQTIVERMAECAICFEPLAEGTDPVVRLASRGRSCGHYLHRSCAERWRQREPRCPVCRAPFDATAPFPNPVADGAAWFAAVDADGDGRLSQREVIAALKATVPGLDVARLDAELPGLWAQWDPNGDGAVDRCEVLRAPGGLLAYARAAFRGARRDGAPPPPLSRPDDWFAFWDYDGSGALDRSEVHRALAKTFGIAGDAARVDTMAETLGAVWCLFDADGNGTIDRSEFAMADGLGSTLHASLGAPPPRPAPPVLEATVVGYAGAAAPLEAAVVGYQNAPPPSYLPPGWEACRAPDGRTYYTNHHTQTTQWDRPAS